MSYPDYDLITELRQKFSGDGFKTLTEAEAIDLIDHLGEALNEAQRENEINAPKALALDEVVRFIASQTENTSYLGVSKFFAGMKNAFEVISEIIAKTNPMVGKVWSKEYSLESVSDFYADDDFEDAITAVVGFEPDITRKVRITIEEVIDET